MRDKITRRNLLKNGFYFTVGTATGLSIGGDIEAKRRREWQQNSQIESHYQCLNMLRTMLDTELASRHSFREMGIESRNTFEAADAAILVIKNMRSKITPIASQEEGGKEYGTQEDFKGLEMAMLAKVLDHAISEGAGCLVRRIIDEYPDFLLHKLTVHGDSIGEEKDFKFDFTKAIENYGQNNPPDMPLEISREDMNQYIEQKKAEKGKEDPSPKALAVNRLSRKNVVLGSYSFKYGAREYPYRNKAPCRRSLLIYQPAS